MLKGGQQMAALLALITDIHSLGLPAAQGLLLTTSFYWDMDDKTREWSKRYFAKMNRMPTMWQAGVYSSVMHYLNAIKDTGTDDPLKVAAKMREKPIEDFFARNGRLREDNLMVHDLMLVQVKRPEEIEISVGLLQDPGEDFRRGGVRTAGSGVSAGEEVNSGADVSASSPRRRPGPLMNVCNVQAGLGRAFRPTTSHCRLPLKLAGRGTGWKHHSTI